MAIGHCDLGGSLRRGLFFHLLLSIIASSIALGATPAFAGCPGLAAPGSIASALTGVLYDPIAGVMKACVGNNWVSLGTGGGGASALSGLSDVSVTGIGDGKSLVYNSTSSKWEPQTINGGSSVLSALVDVDTTGVADGKSLVYNATSSKWVPMTVSSGGSGTVSGTIGKIAKFTGAAAVGDSIITESSGAIDVAGSFKVKAQASGSEMVLDTSTAGQTFGVLWKDNNAAKWQLFKDSSHGFGLYDYTRSANVLTIGANGNMVLMPVGGNVGIGTTGIANKLDLAGSMRVGTGSGIEGIGFGDPGSALSAGGVYIVRGNQALTGSGNYLHLGTWSGLAVHTTDTPASPGTAKMTIDNSGNMDVAGTITGGGTSNGWFAMNTAGLISGTGSWSAIPGLTTTFTLTRAAKVILSASIAQRPASGVMQSGWRFVIDGTGQGNGSWGHRIMRSQAPETHHMSGSMMMTVNLGAGSHTVSIQVYDGSGGSGSGYFCAEGNGTFVEYDACELKVDAYYQ